MKSHVFVPWVIMFRVRMDETHIRRLLFEVKPFAKSFILLMAANHSFVGKIKSSDGTS